MSNDALRRAFHVPMRDPTAKAVLVALAEHANEQWTCWPSVRRLCLFTGLAERTVRYALRRLVSMGAITLTERPNQTCMVMLDRTWPGMSCTPAGDAPPPLRPVHPPPAADAPTPASVAPESSRTLNEPSGQMETAHAATAEPRGTRLAADWRPGPDERRYALARGLDPDRLAEEFRNYWCAVPGARGRKLDWPATFRNRCLQRAGREGLARGGDGVVAAAERVLQRRGLGLA